jgi:hypothetical protein
MLRKRIREYGKREASTGYHRTTEGTPSFDLEGQRKRHSEEAQQS